MAAPPSTMTEALGKIVSDISQAMVAPDADLPFLTTLQGVIVGRMRQGAGGGMSPPGGPGGQPPAPPGAGLPPAAGGPGGPPPPGAGAGPLPGGPPGGLPPGAGPPPGAQLAGPPGPNGVTPLAPAPNPDELRRMIAQKAGA